MTTRFELGDVLGDRFRLEEMLGRGGFATVYRATDLVEGGAVAVKVLKPGAMLKDPNARRRFEREAEILRRLDHPGLARLIAWGDANDGGVFFAMELVPGEDLSDLLARRGRLDAAQTTSILRSLLQALDAAHSLGIIHRDIKPENIRVLADQQVKLLDFGIARETEGGSPSLTATGELLGTPRYMSPEQLRGRPLSPRSDIYSLGLVAVELLTGREMLAGNRPLDQLDRLRSGHIFALPPAVADSTLARVVARMTAQTPDDRYPSARAVLQALEPSPAEAAPPGEPPPAPRSWVGRGVVGTLVVCACLVALWLLRAGPRVPTPPPPGYRPPPEGLVAQPNQPAPPAPKRSAPPVVPERPDAAPPHGPNLTGCGLAPPFRGPGTLSSGPAFIPWEYHSDVRYPVVVLLHDAQQDPKEWLPRSGFVPLANEHGFVVIAPLDRTAILSPVGPHNPWREGAEDRAQVKRAVESAMLDLCLDASRVFVVGNGYGATLASDLSCDGWVTGLATNSFYLADDPKCAEPQPLLILAPRKSAKIPFEGGESCNGRMVMSHAERERIWRDRNGCLEQPGGVVTLPHGSCTMFTCEVPLMSCAVEGGYGWPGAARTIEAACGDVETPAPFLTAAVGWEFFAALPPLPISAAAGRDAAAAHPEGPTEEQGREEDEEGEDRGEDADRRERAPHERR